MKAISRPRIEKFNIDSLQESTVYIGAVGFEDRALAILSEVKRLKETFEYIIGIEYEPADPRDRKDEFQRLASEAISQERNIRWVSYNRESPGRFDEALNLIRQMCFESAHVCLDISAMSKLLILIVLQALRDLDTSLTIVYAEAKVYHPTPKEFEKGYEDVEEMMPKRAPEFLTSGVYKVVTTPALSSVAMQGYPTALVVFPTFNHNLFLALLNEVTPQDLTIVEGEPPKPHNKWRREAIRRVNEKWYPLASKIKVASTFDYLETTNRLEELYETYKFTHEFVIAPANSKLQTVGVFVFKQMHPEVQIAYPTPRGFFDQYTEDVEEIYQIPFSNFRHFIETLDGHRRLSLAELEERLAAWPSVK